MRKVKFLAIVMVMALALMGVGYAYWQDTITLETTVQTGEFNVAFVPNTNTNPSNCYVVYDNPPNNHDGAGVATLTTAAFSDSNDKVVFSLGNLYPECSGVIYLKLANTGTIPARFQAARITVVSESGEDFSSHFVVKGAFSEDGTAYTDFISNWVPVAQFATLMNASTALKNVVIDADRTGDLTTVDNDLFIKIPFKFADVVGGQQVGAEQFENSTLKITVDFDWAQWNI